MPLLSFFSNPLCLAAATIITIGVVVYAMINNQNEEKPYTNGGRSGSGSDFCVPDSSDFTFYESSDSSVRRRKREKRKTVPCTSSKGTKNNINDTKSDGSKETVRNSEFDEKNYYKNVFDKIENDVKNINQKDEKKNDFVKNIVDDDSVSPENNNPVNLNEPKLVNNRISAAFEPEKNVRSSSSVNRINDESNAINQQAHSVDHSSVGATGVNNQQNVTSFENVMCMACEEICADAVAYPCKHRYLCESCAIMVHRIYKKCTICDSVVEKFETVER